MHVIIVGVGEVGGTITANLAESNEVVVDVDSGHIDALTYSLDVLALKGDGTSLAPLEETRVGEVDMLIASTDDDETNLLTCATAKTLSDVFTVARVENVGYFATWERAPGAFGVDHLVCTNLLAVQDVVRIIGLPAARAGERIAGGPVQVAELVIDERSPVVDQTIREADRWRSLTFATLLREDEVVIPSGDRVVEAGDLLVVIASSESIRSSAASIAPEASADVDDVVVFGRNSGEYHVAPFLQNRGLRPRHVDQDEDRAREFAVMLPGTVVMEHDATDVKFVEREGIDEAGAVVAALKSDQQNLLVFLLADRLGVDRTIAVVETGEYIDLFQAVGVGVAVNPRRVVAEEITLFTRTRRTENVAITEDDRARGCSRSTGAASSRTCRGASSAASLVTGSSAHRRQVPSSGRGITS